MQIQADAGRYKRIWTPQQIHTRYAHDIHFFTNTYTIKRPKLDMHAAKPLCEVYVSACIMYVSTIYPVHICMYLVHICMYCLYPYVSMRLTNLAAKDTYRYIQYIQIYIGYIQDMHLIFTGYSKNTGMISESPDRLLALYVSGRSWLGVTRWAGPTRNWLGERALSPRNEQEVRITEVTPKNHSKSSSFSMQIRTWCVYAGSMTRICMYYVYISLCLYMSF